MAEEATDAHLVAIVAAPSLSDGTAGGAAGGDGVAGGDDDADFTNMGKMADLFNTLRILSSSWRSTSEDTSSPPSEEEVLPAAAGGAGPPLAQPTPPSSSSSDCPEPSPVTSLVPEIAAADPMTAMIPTVNIGIARDLVRALALGTDSSGEVWCG